jgi:hypothetical protein
MQRRATLALLVVAIGLFLLAACASQAKSGGPTSTATDPPRATSDQSWATPAFGFAELPESQGPLPLQLHSLPDENSGIAGQSYPGDDGQILGFDATQTWVLVRFGETVGWTPVDTLALLIAN